MVTIMTVQLAHESERVLFQKMGKSKLTYKKVICKGDDPTQGKKSNLVANPDCYCQCSL